MKIKLEQALASCPSQLSCVACGEKFPTKSIRPLLVDHSGLILGDLCPHCLKSKADGIKQTLKQRAFKQLELQPLPNRGTQKGEFEQKSQDEWRYRHALDLLEASQEPLQLPTLFQWWLKRLEILSQETQELENARFGRSPCTCGKERSRLQIRFQADHQQD